jgi:hypothetical protein
LPETYIGYERAEIWPGIVKIKLGICDCGQFYGDKG